jgi:predicted nucleotidyltransferase
MALCPSARQEGVPSGHRRDSLDIADNVSTIDDEMSSTALAGALFPKTRSAILRELYREPDGLHLRELERRTGVNSRHVARELHALAEVGILKSRRVGRQVIYSLDARCPIYEELRSITRKTVGIADVLREELATLADRIELAYVYGSHARGEERNDSDVDLMVVGRASLRDLSSPLRVAAGVLRREINPTAYRLAEYDRARQDAESFVRRIHDGPRIPVLGGDA